MDIHIQKTSEIDFFKTEYLTREAFWNVYQPGCDEHLVLHAIRKSKSYIDDLDLVAVFENQIVGHVISTKAKIVDSNNHDYEVLCLGPISVFPDFQNKGIGSALMNESIQLARKLDFKGIVLYGNPDYYHRFGFRNAQEYSITTKDGQNFEPFMVLELETNALDNVNGKFFEDEAFVSQTDELIEFEKQFPYKEKLVTDTQLKH